MSQIADVAATGSSKRPSVEHVMVVVPVHDEAARLPAALDSVAAAGARVRNATVTVVVVLDACADGSAAVAAARDVEVVTIDQRCVGAARAAGFARARSMRPDDIARTWYATTDADSRVGHDWLTRQLDGLDGGAVDAVLGVVRVPDWAGIDDVAIRRYLDRYESSVDVEAGTHTHVHGANMGFRASAYWHVGGFAALNADEDVDLVHRLEAAGHPIRRDPFLWVDTSARPDGRAPDGFAGHLRELAADTPSPP